MGAALGSMAGPGAEQDRLETACPQTTSETQSVKENLFPNRKPLRVAGIAAEAGPSAAPVTRAPPMLSSGGDVSRAATVPTVSFKLPELSVPASMAAFCPWLPADSPSQWSSAPNSAQSSAPPHATRLRPRRGTCPPSRSVASPAISGVFATTAAACAQGTRSGARFYTARGWWHFVGSS